MGVIVSIFQELPAWVLLSLGFYIAYRVLKFPDLTVDASFVTGTVGTAFAALSWHSSLIGMFFAISLGAIAGICTGLLYLSNPRPAFKLLSSVLVLLAFYSVNYRILGYRVAVGFLNEPTGINKLAGFEVLHGLGLLRPVTLIFGFGIVLITFYLYYLLLRSEMGLLLRGMGTRPWLTSKSNFRNSMYLLFGLGICNGTVALGGWIYASINSFASINVFGTIMHALASALIGEAIIERIYKGPDRRVAIKPLLLAPFWGALIYQILRAFGSWVMIQVAMSKERVVNINQQDFNTIVAVFIIILVLFVRYFTRNFYHELIGSGPASGEGE